MYIKVGALTVCQPFSFNPHKNPAKKAYYYYPPFPYFTDEETEAQAILS